MIDVLVLSLACLTDVNRAIYRRLAQRGWKIQIVIPDQLPIGHGIKVADPDEPEDPPLHRRELLDRANLRAARFAGTLELLDELGPRLIMVDSDPASRMAFQAGRWARKHDARVVCISCENIPRSVLADLSQGQLRKAARSAMINTAMRLCRRAVDHVFSISNDGTALWERSSLHGRVSKIPLGFDPAIFHPNPTLREQTRARLGLDRLTIAYFGRINRQKGIHVLIEALGQLREKDWQFLLDEFPDSKDSYPQELSAQIDRLGIRDRLVRFEARHGEMGAYMNAADIVVVPSLTTPAWKEQYGRVAPEAMACGKVVLVSDCGALPELVGDAGIVVPENDATALTDALKRIMDDPDGRVSLGHKAARRAAEELSLDRQCELMHQTFIRLLGGASASAK